MNTYQLKNSTIEDRIRLYYLEDYELSKDDEIVKDRVNAIQTLRNHDYETERESVNIIVKRFSVSLNTAYRDLRIAKSIFGDMHKANKDDLRFTVTEWSRELYKRSIKTNNLKGMEKALERMTKANNLDKEDMDIPDVTKIQPPVQLLSVNFNFINSPMFKLCDDSTQKALLQLYDEFMEQAKLSQLAEYTDLWKIDDQVRPNKD